MRKVIYGGASSLDGFFTGPGGAMDWLHFSKDVEAVIAQSWANTDALLFGRKTWEGALAQGGGAAAPGLTSYVFSRTLADVPDGVTLVRDDAGRFVRDLKTQPGKDIIVMSGGNLARSLFEADAIDEVGLNIHPVLLGSGVPAFLDAGIRVNLELTECRALDGGCVLVTYRVKR
jgi:dihydrofolate reductase